MRLRVAVFGCVSGGQLMHKFCLSQVMTRKVDSLQASSVQASQSQQTSPQSQPSPSSQRNSPQTSSSSTSSSGTMSSSSSSSSAAERPTPASEYLHNSSSPAGFRPPHELPSPFFSNSNGIFRPGFPTYQPPAHHHPPVVHAAAAAAAANSMHNGNGKCKCSQDFHILTTYRKPMSHEILMFMRL